MVSRRTPAGRIEEQIAYYRARAPEYDEWFFRQGRYDRGPEDTRRWFAEFFVDNRFPRQGAASDTLQIDRERNTVRRSLRDGREFEIVKVYHTAQELGRELASLGFDSDVRATENFFLYGDARANTCAPAVGG